MPTYEYQCLQCDQTFEFFQSMKEEPLKTCPELVCPHKPWGQGSVKRLLGTGAGLIFKGSGFYITDYRSEGYKQSAKKDVPASDSKKETKSTPTPPASPSKAPPQKN